MVKNLPATQETQVLSLGQEDGAGHGNSLQYSCLENSMDRGAWQATVHGVAKSWTAEQPTLSLHFLFRELRSQTPHDATITKNRTTIQQFPFLIFT